MTLAEARRQWKKRRRQWAVGYVSSGNVIYLTERHRCGFAMTRREAEVALADLATPTAAVIFRLTPVQVGKPASQTPKE